uniref:UDP-glucose--hexose-1-phosphate uridylyltransferase n=1 Tax=Globodera rostochiensis TaxID=31243 RepID=A0A914HL63_GLORO
MLRRIKKYEHRLSDGRELIYYDDADTKLDPKRREDGRQPSQRPQTARMRQDPLIGDWVSVAVARQNRAYLPPAECDPLAPQCATNPGAEIPSCYDVAVFENKSPAFGPLLEPPAWSPPQGLTELGTIGLGREMTSVGRCEVVCFTPEHSGSFGTFSPSRARTIIEAWADRTAALSAIPNIQQIFPFANCGEAVTLHHPHGQIYAYPYITPRTQALIASLDKYGPSLFADILLFEQSGERLVLAGDHWTAFVPFAARWPIEVHILPHRHIADIAATSEVERAELATVYLRVLRGIDELYADGTPTPYTVAWHQAPVHVRRDEIRLMCQITSPRRAVDKLKFVAGSEAAMGAWVGDIVPELGAKSLREAIQRADAEKSVGILPEDIGGIGQEA